MGLGEHAVLPAAAHLEQTLHLVRSHVRILQRALVLNEGGYPDLYDSPDDPAFEAVVATGWAGLPRDHIAESLNSATSVGYLLDDTQAELRSTEDGRLVVAFLGFLSKLRPRSKRELLRFLEEDDERMWAVMCTREAEVASLYRLSDDTRAEFGLLVAKEIDKSTNGA